MRTRPPAMAMNPVVASFDSSTRTLSSPERVHPAVRGSAIESHCTPGKTVESPDAPDSATDACREHDSAAAAMSIVTAAVRKSNDRGIFMPDIMVSHLRERKMRMLRTTAIVTLSFLAGAGAMWAQQQQATGRVPQFENEHMKAWKTVIMPKQPLRQHRHEFGRALIALTDGQLKVVDPNGKVVNTYNWERGKAYWLGPDPAGETHADVNDTAQPIEVIVVELKKN